VVVAEPEVEQDRADDRMDESVGLLGFIGEVAERPESTGKLIGGGRRMEEPAVVRVEYGDADLVESL